MFVSPVLHGALQVRFANYLVVDVALLEQLYAQLVLRRCILNLLNCDHILRGQIGHVGHGAFSMVINPIQVGFLLTLSLTLCFGLDRLFGLPVDRSLMLEPVTQHCRRWAFESCFSTVACGSPGLHLRSTDVEMFPCSAIDEAEVIVVCAPVVCTLPHTQKLVLSAAFLSYGVHLVRFGDLSTCSTTRNRRSFLYDSWCFGICIGILGLSFLLTVHRQSQFEPKAKLRLAFEPNLQEKLIDSLAGLRSEVIEIRVVISDSCC